METGKTTKPALPAGRYLKYAIGEIVLVIIGILIALQISNWNEDRVSNITTNNYLKALVNEIEKNVNWIESDIKRVHQDIKESANSLKQLNIPEAKFHSDSLIRSAMDTRPIYKSILSKSTFNDLINAGVLKNLKNVELKDRILSIEPYIESCYESSKKAENAWDSYQLPYLLKNNNVSSNWDSISGVKIYKVPFKIKRDAFVHNYDYANILSLRMKMMDNYELQLTNTKKAFIEISDEIKNHLKN